MFYKNSLRLLNLMVDCLSDPCSCELTFQYCCCDCYCMTSLTLVSTLLLQIFMCNDIISFSPPPPPFSPFYPLFPPVNCYCSIRNTLEINTRQFIACLVWYVKKYPLFLLYTLHDLSSLRLSVSISTFTTCPVYFVWNYTINLQFTIGDVVAWILFTR